MNMMRHRVLPRSCWHVPTFYAFFFDLMYPKTALTLVGTFFTRALAQYRFIILRLSLIEPSPYRILNLKIKTVSIFPAIFVHPFFFIVCDISLDLFIVRVFFSSTLIIRGLICIVICAFIVSFGWCECHFFRFFSDEVVFTYWGEFKG